MKVMRKEKQNVRLDHEKTCYYCGKTVKDGEGTYTDKRKLLICLQCKPKFFTPLKKIRRPNIRVLESGSY